MSAYGEWNYGATLYSTADVSPSMAAASAAASASAVGYGIYVSSGTMAASGSVTASSVRTRLGAAQSIAISSFTAVALGVVYSGRASLIGSSIVTANATATYNDPASFSASSSASTQYIRIRNTAANTIAVGSVITVGREKWETIPITVRNWSATTPNAVTWTKITDGVTL